MAAVQTHPLRADVPRGTLAGGAIVACTLVELFAVAHHPTVTSSSHVLERIAALRTLGIAVHGAIIAMIVTQVWALATFTIRRGLERELAVAGFVAYGLGSAALIGAGILDGFVIPAIAETYAPAKLGAGVAPLQILSVCAMTIQALSKFGFFAVSAGVFAWSIDLACDNDRRYALGALGCVAALGGAALTASGILNPHLLTTIVFAQGVWFAALGTQLARGRL